MDTPPRSRASAAEPCPIRVLGATEHNLKDLDVEIPDRQLTVVTGVSGSGKSSLAFDTLFREGQRRYLAALSAHARQFLGRQHRPAARAFENLPAALAVDQRTTVTNPRSTVGTLTELYDYLRLLFARIGELPDGTEASAIGTHTFSFNSDQGACPACRGLAVTDAVDPELLVADPARTLRGGALVPTLKSGYIVYSQVTIDVLNDVCQAHGFDVDTPWQDLLPEHRDVIFFGSDRLKVPFGKHTLESRMRWSGITARPREEGFYKGLIPTITATLARDRNKNILRFVRSVPCETCAGTRLSALARSVRVGGSSLAELVEAPLAGLRDIWNGWRLEDADSTVATPILQALEARLGLLLELGLGHLELGRGSMSLSGGEAQRIRLAAQVGSGLQGVLYVLDEPSIGLHAAETAALVGVLHRLRDQGNTVVCVEHDGTTIAAADHLIELGPGAGDAGGALIASLPLPQAGETVASPTLRWLASAHLAPLPGPEPSPADPPTFWIRNARAHNLRGISVPFRRQALNIVTGVSGAGKSTLVDGILATALRQSLHGATAWPGAHDAIEEVDAFTKLVHVDQRPIGRTPRSNPATYTGVFDAIRALFAGLPAATEAGFGKGHFSTNVAGGRCEDCQGAGHHILGMHGLTDVEIRCGTCGGKRFADAVLAVRFADLSIADVLDLSVTAARTVFREHPGITRVLETLDTLGLGYLRLGQSATSVSGGEAQRIKLATELARPAGRGETLYILDEPTTGLHAEDILRLRTALEALVARGDTVVLIEHDLEWIAGAQHVVDLGPGSGRDGGALIYAGSPGGLTEEPRSVTGRALAQFHASGYAGLAPPSPAGATATPAADQIQFRGVTTHNLKGIDVALPHRGMTVITGVSGSGKTSLAFETIHGESQRRFAENLSTRARRHLPRSSAARFEEASGLTPSIALRQRPADPNRRSTVGTVSEVLDSLRLLYSRAGTLVAGAPRLSARHFSFNHPEGACPECRGIGTVERCDPDKLVTDPSRSLFDGAMDGTRTGKFYGERDGQYLATLAAVEAALDHDFHRSYADLDAESRAIAMFGCGDRVFDVTWDFARKGRSGQHSFSGPFPGFAGYVDEEYARKREDRRGEAMRSLLTPATCPACGGARLRSDPAGVQVAGRTLPEICQLPICDALTFFDSAFDRHSDATTQAIAAEPRAEIQRRLGRVVDLGLGYLSLDRPAATLSGGEAQRLRIAAQIDTRLHHVTYVLDEPTIGLHPRDTARLLDNLATLQATSTLVVVEHDPTVQAAADHVIALGPGAGAEGGRVVAAGPPRDVPPCAVRDLPPRTLPDLPTLALRGAAMHNLVDVDVAFPTGALVAVAGVSGSGKSTLVFEVLRPTIESGRPVGCVAVDAPEFEAVHAVDHRALAASGPSTPATVLGVFDAIRKIFAATESARAEGLKPAAFSLTTKGKDGAGRCPECEGLGAIRTGLDFLPDVWHRCEVCDGQRFAPRTLACRWEGRGIAEILGLTLTEALTVFAGRPALVAALRPAVEIGLGFLRLGQPARTLSGGEAQRLKLAAELSQGHGGPHLYLLDEPTRGLHADDVSGLLTMLRRLTERGDTVVVVEHNVDLLRNADHVLELGPDAGVDGGRLIFSGTPAAMAEASHSVTGSYLRRSPAADSGSTAR